MGRDLWKEEGVNLRTLLAIILTMTGLTVVGLSAALIKVTNLLEDEVSDIVLASESVRIAEELESMLLAHTRIAFLHLVDDEPLRFQRREQLRNASNRLLNFARESMSGEEEAEAIEAVDRTLTNYLDMRNRLDRSNLDPLIQYRQIVNYLDETFEAIDRLVEINIAQSSELQATVDRQNRMAWRMGYGLIVAAVLLAGLLAIGTMKLIYRPLLNLRTVISKYGSGASTQRARLEGVRETREIAETFNAMADHLEERRQERLRFLASISHDLRNPLSSMSMAAELMLSNAEESGNEQDRRLPAIIRRQVKNLDRLVGDLMDTSRIEAGYLELKPVSTDVRQLVQDSVELYRSSSDIHRFKLKLPEAELKCECDPGRMAQVMNNLLSNAVKYSPSGGDIVIRAEHTDRSVGISVCDEGMGIEVGDLDSIFNPFSRSRATRETIPGIGLGLSASRRIVEAHGGTLTVKSNPGKGSTFTVLLPVNYALQEMGMRAQEHPPQPQPQA